MFIVAIDFLRSNYLNLNFVNRENIESYIES